MVQYTLAYTRGQYLGLAAFFAALHSGRQASAYRGTCHSACTSSIRERERRLPCQLFHLLRQQRFSGFSFEALTPGWRPVSRSRSSHQSWPTTTIRVTLPPFQLQHQAPKASRWGLQYRMWIVDVFINSFLVLISVTLISCYRLLDKSLNCRDFCDLRFTWTLEQAQRWFVKCHDNSLFHLGET